MEIIKQWARSILKHEIRQKEELINELSKEITNKNFEEMEKNNEKGYINEVNNSFEQGTILFYARNNKQYDVREFIFPNSYILKRFGFQRGLNLSSDNDFKAYKVLLYLQKSFKYKTDKSEFWKYPTDTLYDGYGDCEDLSLLYISILRNLNVPAYRLKVACGNVLLNNKLIGHAYPIYLREADDEWIHLDICYFPNNLRIEDRSLGKNDENYKDIWFTFNDQYSWYQGTLKMNKDKIRKWKR